MSTKVTLLYSVLPITQSSFTHAERPEKMDRRRIEVRKKKKLNAVWSDKKKNMKRKEGETDEEREGIANED